MRSPGALRLVVASSCSAALLAAACGNSDGSNVNGSASGNGNTSAKAGTTGGPDLGSLGGASNGSDGVGGDGIEECAGDLVEAQRVPLDMYVMLDVSGSMLSPTEGDMNVTKWQAVSSALSGFISDDASAGIGVGLQVFRFGARKRRRVASRIKIAGTSVPARTRAAGRPSSAS